MHKFKPLILLLALLIGTSFSVNTAQAVPPAVKAKSEFLLADKLFNKQDYKGAIEHAEKAKSILGKSNSRIEYMLAKAYFQNADFDKAMKAVNAFFEVTPESESTGKQYNEVVALYSEIEVAHKGLEKKLQIETKLVSGGCFHMGNTFGDGHEEEKPVHEVCLDSFHIGKYEVTQGQWQAIMGTTVAQQRDKKDTAEKLRGQGDKHPMYYVNWNDVQNFINKLNRLAGKNYRLPTEAEWEYACRSGGKKEKYCGGNDPGRVAWYEENSGKTTHRVGGKTPNGLGIYDMSGNIGELCSDFYDENYYKNSPLKNPKGPSSGSCKLTRGNAWHMMSFGITSSARVCTSTDYRSEFTGFRLVLPAGQ